MFEEITILAPGLLGASIAQAIRLTGNPTVVRLWARRPETRLALSDVSWCDRVHPTPETAVEGAGLVVVCTPVTRIVPLIKQVKRSLRQDAIVTDVGSVKGLICRDAHAQLAGHARFVGSHPMAGSEKSGWEHARQDLFSGRPCFVTPLPETDPGAVDRVADFWTGLGARVRTISPDRHDEIVAHISHLPHVTASLLCRFLGTLDSDWKHYAGSGLKDTTRIAAGDAELWRDILEQNRDEILRALRGFQSQLDEFHAALANNDFFAIRHMLKKGKQYRDEL